MGNLTRLVYPDNTAVNYAYDANHNLVSVTDWANRVTAYTYDVNNRVVGVTKPDGSVTTTVYDNKQRVTSTVERTATGVVITGFKYIYDALGRLIEEVVLANNTKMCYSYDSLNRVTKRTIKNLSDVVLTEESYTYDAAGNIVGGSVDTAFVYDTNNRLTSYNGQTITCDMDGNMLSAPLDCVTTNFTYDSANRLISARGNAYTYNAKDTRIKNLCGGDESTYTYNTNATLSQLLQKTTNGSVTKYVYGLGLIGEEAQSCFKTYHFDYRGSTVAITDINGNVTDTFEYDTYGRIISRTGISIVIFGYNGRDGVITDKNGLIYMRARYYAPELRRFVNADIVAGEISDAVTLNRYAYANGNPVSNVDPFGLAPERGSFLNGLWDGFKSGHELMLTIISAPGNALRNLILALGNGDYKNAPGDFVKGLTGEKQTSVMDLGVSKEKQQEFYNNQPILYQLSDSTLSMIDPSMFIGGGGMKSAMGSKATINYSDYIAKFALNYSDEAAEVFIKNSDDIIKGAGSPSTLAKTWQGSGNYPGVDNWVDVTLPKGTKVWGSAPGQSNFYTTNIVMKSVGNDATMLNQGLQIGKNGYSTFRPGMTMYELTDEVTVGYSKALANPKYGAGGFDQYFFNNTNSLDPVLSRIMGNR